MIQPIFGWKPDPEGAAAILEDPSTSVRTFSRREKSLISRDDLEKPIADKPPIILIDATVALRANWVRGAQGIGDCVSWGYCLGVDVAFDVDCVINKEPWKLEPEAATEPAYGGGRVEARDRDFAGWQDGSYGAAQAKWLTTKGGVILRRNYSVLTNSPDDDFTRYDAKKAKDYGAYGCGGRDDRGRLDKIATERQVKVAVLVRNYAEAVAAIENGYPVAVCSGQGLSKRGRDGFAEAEGSWAHCMLFCGVRYDIPGLLCANSWGNSWGTRAPFYPRDYPHANVKKCCAWVRANVCDRMLRQKDSYTLSPTSGLKRREIVWHRSWDIPGRRTKRFKNGDFSCVPLSLSS